MFASVALAASLVTLGIVAADRVEGATAAATPAARDPAANAALDWWRAFSVMPPKEHAIWAAVEASTPDTADPVVDGFFAGGCTALDLLALGARNDVCHWGVGADESVHALLPHLTKLKDLTRLAVLRAGWHARRGDHARAVDDLVTCLRTARLAAGSPATLIEGLVAYAVEARAQRAAAGIAPLLPGAERDRLRAAIDALPATASPAAMLAQEVAFMQPLFARLLAMPEAERRGFDAIPAHELTDARLRLASEQHVEQIARVRQWLALPARERAATPPPSAEGLHPLVRTLLPAVETIAGKEVRVHQQRALLVAGLDVLQRGDAALAAHADPATGDPFRLLPATGGFRLLGAGAELVFVPPGAATPAAADGF